MITFELTDDDAKLLAHIMEEYLSDLRMEIVDTDSSDYKEQLRAEKALVNDIIARLKHARGLDEAATA